MVKRSTHRCEKPVIFPKNPNDFWYSEISPNGHIKITLNEESRIFTPKEIIILINHFCKKNDRFAEVAIEGSLMRYIEKNYKNPTPKVFCFCALYSALRSSIAYDSPYGGGKNSVFSIPAFFGCTTSPHI